MPLVGDSAGGGVGLSRWRRFIAAGFLVWFLAGTAIVGGAIGIALLLLRGDDVSVSSPIAVGEGPLRLATSTSAVWVTSASDGTLSRIDPETRKVVAATRIGRGISGVAVGYGFVWITRPGAGEVLLIDPAGAANQRPRRIAIGGRPGAIVLAGGRAWVADEGGTGITAINAQGPRVYKRGIAPQAGPLRLAAGAGGLWVSSATSGTIRRIDLGDAVAGPTIPVGRGPSGITVAGGIVWVANSRGDTVTRVDPVTGVPFGERIPVGDRPGGIDAGTDSVWVANNGDDSVTRIDIGDGEPVGDPIGVGPAPGAVAIGEKAVWVANNGDGTVTRIEP